MWGSRHNPDSTCTTCSFCFKLRPSYGGSCSSVERFSLTPCRKCLLSRALILKHYLRAPPLDKAGLSRAYGSAIRETPGHGRGSGCTRAPVRRPRFSFCAAAKNDADSGKGTYLSPPKSIIGFTTHLTQITSVYPHHLLTKRCAPVTKAGGGAVPNISG